MITMILMITIILMIFLIKIITEEEDYDDHRTEAVVLHDIAGHLSKFSQISLPTVYCDVPHLVMMIMMMMTIILMLIMILLHIPEYLFCTR